MGLVLSLEELLPERARLRVAMKTVVFTNGVFDLLHRGHCEYLEQARAQGDALIVGLNSDASVRRIKGELKPIVPEGDRAFILSRLTGVDFVTLFDEDTPRELIAALLPDVLVKGADYRIESIVGREEVERAGGRVVTIAFTPDRSSTNIVQTIIDRYCS